MKSNSSIPDYAGIPFGTIQGLFMRFALALFVGLTVFGSSAFAQNTEELVTEADLKALRQKSPDYFRALNSSSLTQADTKLVQEFMQVQVLQMAIPSKERELPEIREKLKREIDLRAKPASRAVMLEAIVENARKLLDHPLPIKLNAVMLITELNENPGQIAKSIPPAPYMGMVDTLLEVINDPEQHESLKVVAANGLHRLCRDNSPKVDLRLRIAEALIKQLDDLNNSEWFRMVCIQALSRTDVLNDATRKPFVLQKLGEILVDPKQGWRARAEAAAAIGRVPMDSSSNVELLLHEIARFAHDLGQAYNKNRSMPQWRYCAIRLYLAFKPEDPADTSLLDRATRPPLARFRSDVQDVYGLVLPVVNGIIGSLPPAPIPNQDLKALKDWIDANAPSNLSVSLDPSVKVQPLRKAG